MNGPSVPVTCADFDEAVDELAVEGVAEPRRSELLAHAAGCAPCEGRLDELAAVADRMLLLAPAVEPPPGFESRALARMGARPNQRVPRLRLLLAVAAVVAALGAGVVVGRSGAPGEAGRSGAIVSVSGARVGTVELDPSPRPHVVVTVYGSGRSEGVRSCELVLSDGRRVVVGTWTSDEIASGVWAAGIDQAFLEARTMRILGDDGRVIATAELTSTG